VRTFFIFDSRGMVDGHGCQKMMNVGDRKGERYIMWCKVRALLCYILLYRVIRGITLRKYSYVKVCDVQTFWILRVMKDKE